MNYKKIYDSLMERGISRPNIKNGSSFEHHHIIPKCIGGENISTNIANLTLREHFIAHLLLCKIYPSIKGLSFALSLMRKIHKTNSRLYQWIKERNVKIRKGKTVSKDVCHKMSMSKMGHIVSKETREKLRNANLGKKHTKESILKLKASLKGKKWTPLSEEAKRKISKTLTGRKTGKRSDEVRRKISEATKGKKHKPVSIEVIKRRAETLKMRTILKKQQQKNF